MLHPALFRMVPFIASGCLVDKRGNQLLAAEGHSGCGVTWWKPEPRDAVEGRWGPAERQRSGGILSELRWEQTRSRAWGSGAAGWSRMSSCTAVITAHKIRVRVFSRALLVSEGVNQQKPVIQGHRQKREFGVDHRRATYLGSQVVSRVLVLLVFINILSHRNVPSGRESTSSSNGSHWNS